ncbi:MAG TPA: VOC family protein [Opitutaceae bacterium]
MRSFAFTEARLHVSSLARAEAFYAGILGLHANRPQPEIMTLRARLGADPLLTLIEKPDAVPKPVNVPGLFHVALLLPNRAALARVLRRLALARYPLEGMGDHGVSEALYLSDPDSIGLELYADRPRSVWPRPPGNTQRVAMGTTAVDVDNLLAAAPDGEAHGLPPGTIIGHVHLRVADLAATRAFYTEHLGMDVMQDDFPGALFLGADGYHHHFGANTWGGPARPATTPVAGLLSVHARIADLAAPRSLTDPDGIQLELIPA